jgi:hypothetical protein
MLKDRLMFVDIVRGAAIIGVILVHSSVYGIWYNEPNALKVLPTAAVAALSPLILLATWAGAFALITGLVNAYNITRRVGKGRRLGQACAAPAVNAGVLMVIWIAVALLFTHRRHGIFGGGEVFSLISGSLALGRFTPPDLQTLFYKDALVMISLSGFTSALAMRLILRNMDVSNQDHLRRAVSILFAWGAVFLVASAFLQSPLFGLFERLWNIGTPGALIAALVCQSAERAQSCPASLRRFRPGRIGPGRPDGLEARTENHPTVQPDLRCGIHGGGNHSPRPHRRRRSLVRPGSAGGRLRLPGDTALPLFLRHRLDSAHLPRRGEAHRIPRGRREGASLHAHGLDSAIRHDFPECLHP